ncbi:4Fe-4S dicluster domain-containing protein [Alkalibaculum sp. M08DMB]|uniref:4Fe-4S dicluster domain-containing protein n=1 Tax=Alkalibaculum sporogenes TaxID=2655001 RepID=A0A6A7KBE9_9FIRM|nr:4Fe-4S dicluster domain-containing protein [Alkalibaculum sporogenes]MPW26734.1 4Fe-4S dicluster domain-containing protein [Alkalibaculum sporogenes]
MKFTKATLMYFSPTDTTKKTIENIAKGIAINEIIHMDLTDFDMRWKKRKFEADELVIIGMPVYGGRIAPTAKEIFNRTEAKGTPCIAVVVYGNRAYEDALIELKNKSGKSGFKVISAAAFIGEHAWNNEVANARPDEKDEKMQIDFGQKVAGKIENISIFDEVCIKIPGNDPYKYVKDIHISPETDEEKCVGCGKCQIGCPMKAIDPYDYTRSDNFRCILCFKCIRDCTENARSITVSEFIMQSKLLAAMNQERKKPEIFI